MKYPTYLLLPFFTLGLAHAVETENGPKTVALDLGDIHLDVNAATGEGVDLKIGDDIDAVNDAYGKSLGKAHRAGLEIIMYPRGQVEMKEGKVVAIKMVSKKSYEQKQVRRANRILLEKELEAREKSEKAALGEEKLAKVLADPAFDEKNPIDQLNYWRKFKREYPEVNVDPFFKEALARLNDDKK